MLFLLECPLTLTQAAQNSSNHASCLHLCLQHAVNRCNVASLWRQPPTALGHVRHGKPGMTYQFHKTLLQMNGSNALLRCNHL